MFGVIFVVLVSAFVIFMSWAIVVEISKDDGKPAYIPGALALFGTIWIVVTAIPLIQLLLRSGN